MKINLLFIYMVVILSIPLSSSAKNLIVNYQSYSEVKLDDISIFIKSENDIIVKVNEDIMPGGKVFATIEDGDKIQTDKPSFDLNESKKIVNALNSGKHVTFNYESSKGDFLSSKIEPVDLSIFYDNPQK